MRKWIAGLLAVLIISIPLGAAAVFFPDTEGHWGEEHIFWAAFDVPVFSGYPDGSFRPDANISRAEFITMLSKLLDVSDMKIVSSQTKSLPYVDMREDHWAYSHVLDVYRYLDEAPHADLNVIQIFAGTLLRPEVPITRYEAALLTHSMTTPPIENENETTRFTDLDENDQNYHRIMELAANNIISGYEDRTFRPQNRITRAESAVLARKIYQDHTFLTMDKLDMIVVDTQKYNQYPSLDMPGQKADFTAMDRKLDEVIVTLEYLSIVGFIPYDERDLYDLTPIESLWELKNRDYAHVIANNYYLIAHDSNLVHERKVELAQEALLAYMQREQKNLEGFLLFASTVKPYAQPDRLINALEAYLNRNITPGQAADAAIMLGVLLVEQGRSDEAIALYPPLVDKVNDMEMKMNLIHNEIITRNNERNTEDALSALSSYREKMMNHSQYWFYQDEIDHHFTALEKQLVINNR